MAQYSRTVLTDAGVILARRMMDETITMEFTRIVTGDGQYSSGEDLAARTALKSQKQSFPLSSRSLTDEDRVLHLKYVISNVNPDSSPLTVGYYVREVGIYAHVTGESEILYAVAIADADAADYLPEYDELQPSTITMDWFITVGNTENITIQASPSAYALAEDLADLAEVVDQKLDADGDSKNNTISFTSSDEADSDVTKSTGWATVAPLESGETHESFMTKFSKIVKNLRWLYKLIGTTDISSIGDGTVTKALSVLNANFGKIINSDAELDALSGTCFFGGSYGSTYFGALDYNGVQIDNAQQRTQIVVVTSNLLYRVDDIGTGHEGNWSEWNAIPYNTATLLNSLNNDVANISSLLSSNGETFKFIVLSGVGFDAAYTQTQSNSVSILHILDTQLTAPFASNNFVAIQWKNGTGNFGFQFVLGYDATNSNKIAIRTRGNGVWGNWRTI